MRNRFLCWILPGGIFLILLLLYGRIVIQNDGISYYCLTLSLMRDGDFNLANQAEKFPEVRLTQSKTGMRGSKYSSGFSLLYAPFLFAADSVAGLFPGISRARPYAQNARFPFPHSLAIFSASLLYGLSTLLLGMAILKKLFNYSFIFSSFLALAVFIGGPLIFYTFTCPSFPHAADAFLAAIAFFAALSSSKEIGKVRCWNLLLGFSLALSVLVRNNNAVLVPVFVIGRLLILKKQGIHRPFASALEIFLGALPVFILHLYFNLQQYGNPLATGYGMKKKMTVWRAGLLFTYLFVHPIGGLVLNHPIGLLGMLGLIIGIRKKQAGAGLAAASVIVVMVSLSIVGYVFPGSAFGQRLLVHLYIFWLVGIACFIREFRKIGIALTLVFAFWSFFLMNAYITATYQKMYRFTDYRGFNAFEMIIASRDASKNSGVSIPELWYAALSARPYPTVLPLLIQSVGAHGVRPRNANSFSHNLGARRAPLLRRFGAKEPAQRVESKRD